MSKELLLFFIREYGKVIYLKNGCLFDSPLDIYQGRFLHNLLINRIPLFDILRKTV
jgi:hypothetical protein